MKYCHIRKEMIKFTIPGKPKALKRHRSSSKGWMYDPSAKDKKDIWLQIAQHRPEKPLAGNIYLRTQFYMPYPKNWFKQKAGKPTDILKDKYKNIILHSIKPDLDNLIKMIADIIQPQMIFDDSQIYWISAVKVYDKKPRTEVTIEEVS